MSDTPVINGAINITAPNSENMLDIILALGLDPENGQHGRPTDGSDGPVMFMPAHMRLDFDLARKVAAIHPDAHIALFAEYLDEEKGYVERVEFDLHGNHTHLNTYTSTSGSFEEVFPEALKEEMLFGAPRTEPEAHHETDTKTPQSQ